jgi:hypothetical protein
MHKTYETFFLVPATRNHICTKCRQERTILIKSCSNALRVFVTNGQRRELYRVFRNLLQPRNCVMRILRKLCFDFPLEILFFLSDSPSIVISHDKANEWNPISDILQCQFLYTFAWRLSCILGKFWNVGLLSVVGQVSLNFSAQRPHIYARKIPMHVLRSKVWILRLDITTDISLYKHT